jgi:hypothetical protein
MTAYYVLGTFLAIVIAIWISYEIIDYQNAKEAKEQEQ